MLASNFVTLENYENSQSGVIRGIIINKPIL